MAPSLQSDTPDECGSCPVLFWQILFVVAMALAGAFILISCCLLGGSYYKGRAKENTNMLCEFLEQQARLWREDGEGRLEEQRLKDLAWSENENLRDDNDDLMAENRLLQDEKYELNHRNEQLKRENERLGAENAALAVQQPRVEQQTPEPPHNNPGFSATLNNSGLPPGTDVSLREDLEEDLNSPHGTFPSWTNSGPGTPERTELPPSRPSSLEQDKDEPNLRGLMITSEQLSGREQRRSWGTYSPQPPSEEDRWKPAVPEERRLTFG